MIVRSGLSELVTAAAAADKKGYTPLLDFTEDEGSPFRELQAFRELAIVVNEHLTTDISADERQQLLELLFSPDIPSWAPFVHSLDFSRSTTATLLAELKKLLSSPLPEYSHTAYVIHGRAASGKTVMLKRLAWDLAKSGELVIWLRPGFIGEAGNTVKHLFERIAKIRQVRGKKIVIFMDDPAKSTSFQPREVFTAAQATGRQVLFVTGFRSTDWAARPSSDPLESFPIVEEHELPDELDPSEWNNLPQYLVTLGICTGIDESQQKIQSVPTRQAQDTLSMLYYLLPQTRSMIASSIRDEYFRLGDRAWLSDLLLNASDQSAAILKRAYEMVAVAGHFRTPLPLEVLVSALGVDYDDWMTATNQKGPAWGILYAEHFEEGETVCYRTRNHLVTRILMEAINGGTLGHAGELDLINKLLAVCTGTTPVYREFCLRVLVHNDALSKYEFEDVLKLYDVALAALPFAEKTILHHKARWIRKKGRDPISASKVLDLALDAKPYPYAKRVEIDDHIHTTYAAAIIDAIDQKKMSPGEGKEQALSHLDKARSTNYLDARAVHVQANLIVKLASNEGSLQTPDSVQLIGRALSEVDRALLLLSGPGGERRENADVQMLESIRSDVFVAVGTADTLKEQANQIWEDFRGQQGFVLAARKLYQVAIERNKGTHYKKAADYCQLVINMVREAGVSPAPSLCEVVLHILYRWQIQRAQVGPLGFRIEWDRIETYSRQVLASASLAADPFYKYLLGLSLAHLGQWPQAHALLNEVRHSGVSRELLWEQRDYLLGNEGGPRRVQGEMRKAANGLYFFSEELHTDFQVERNRDWPREKEIAHTHIQFSFGGTRAIKCD